MLVELMKRSFRSVALMMTMLIKMQMTNPFRGGSFRFLFPKRKEIENQTKTRDATVRKSVIESNKLNVAKGK